MSFKLVIFLFLIYNTDVTHNAVTALSLNPDQNNVDGSKTCSISLNACQINFDGMSNFKDIIKQTVPKGEKGSNGAKGDDGLKGDTGLTGDRGPQGPEGKKGSNGEMGPRGEQGLNGDIGPKGHVGLKGDIGPPGQAGLPGSCRCTEPDNDDDNDLIQGNIIGVTGSTEFDPLRTCKHTNTKYKTGIYWIRRTDAFKALCDIERNLTCLIVNKNISTTKIISHGNTTFWLSEKGFIWNLLYKPFTTGQLEWLQSQSTFITQKIRYHCKNSYVYPKGESSTEKALRLLSWKEKLIGPRPSDDMPFYYSIPPDTDGCKDSGDSKTEWLYSDIILNSNLRGLPIIDFHIRDIRNEDQELRIELLELCFG